MTDDFNSTVQRAYDLCTVDTVLGRVCESEEEREAIKRVLGVDIQDRSTAEAFVPERPPVYVEPIEFDHLARTREAITRYAQWVESFPDDDPTPLRERERILRIARRNLERLTGQ